MEQQKTDIDRARQSLRIMQAALEKAKTTHGELFTFGDCASVYAAMMNMNNFIDKHDSSNETPQVSAPLQTPVRVAEPQVKNPVQQNVQSFQQPFPTLQSQPTVSYRTN